MNKIEFISSTLIVQDSPGMIPVVLTLVAIFEVTMSLSSIVHSSCVPKFVLMFFILIQVRDLTAQPVKASCGLNEYYDGYPVQPLSLSSGNILEVRNSIVLSIVIHVVWRNPEENIPDVQILNQVDRLNLDFNDPAVDKRNVPLEFRSSMDNPQIRFCLASKDPSGKNHSGITRTRTTIDFIGSKKDQDNKHLIHYSGKGGEDAWDPTRYINIWVGELDNFFGRSTIGGNVPILAEDGIVIDPKDFKVDLKENKFGRTLVHEMGHYLGLLHTWGMLIGDCTEDDGLADTPLQEGPYYNCPNYPQVSCNTSNMFMNYMDYVDDLCMHLFTKDQVRLMLQTIHTSRNTLSQATGLCTTAPGMINIDSLSIKVSIQDGRILLQSPTLPDQEIFFSSYNVLGQKIAEQSILILRSGEINIKDWPAGIYFLYFRYNKDHRTLKFFKP